jgi:hypothetical protein
MGNGMSPLNRVKSVRTDSTFNAFVLAGGLHEDFTMIYYAHVTQASYSDALQGHGSL